MNELKKPLIFPHCEKTGGSSLITAYYKDQEQLNKRDSSKEFMWFPQWKVFFPLSWLPLTNSDESTDTLKRKSGGLLPFVYRAYFDVILKALQPVTVQPDKITSTNFEVLHGHFTLMELASMMNLDDVTISFVVRDPLERMISHYRHFERVGWYKIPTFRQVFDKGDVPKSFRSFALHPNMQNYQFQVLDQHIDAVDYIGTTNDLSAILRSMGITSPVEHRNAAPRSKDLAATLTELGVDNSFRDEFRAYHEKDYNLYASLV